jgi:hypothetical protein
VKEMKPRINADKRRFKTQSLSALIGVHRRPKRFFKASQGVVADAGGNDE